MQLVEKLCTHRQPCDLVVKLGRLWPEKLYFDLTTQSMSYCMYVCVCVCVFGGKVAHGSSLTIHACPYHSRASCKSMFSRKGENRANPLPLRWLLAFLSLSHTHTCTHTHLHVDSYKLQPH